MITRHDALRHFHYMLLPTAPPLPPLLPISLQLIDIYFHALLPANMPLLLALLR